MTINSRTAGSLRHMKNNLVVWGEKWCPSKNASRSSAGKQGQLLSDGTYASMPESRQTPTGSNIATPTPAISDRISSRPSNPLAKPLPTKPTSARAPPSPSLYLRPPSLEDAECMFDLPFQQPLRPHVSDSKRERRLRRRVRRLKKHLLARGRRPSPHHSNVLERSSVSRNAHEKPAGEPSILPSSHDMLGVAAPDVLISSHHEHTQSLLAPLELDTYLNSYFSFPSQEACISGSLPMRVSESSEFYMPSVYDTFSSGAGVSNSSSELAGGMRGGLFIDVADHNGSLIDCPHEFGCIQGQSQPTAPDLSSTPFLSTSHYDQTEPFQTMSSNGIYSLQGMSFGGSSSMPAGYENAPTVPMSFDSVSQYFPGGDGHFLSPPAGHPFPSEYRDRGSFTDCATVASNPFSHPTGSCGSRAEASSGYYS